jgi:hypothetical protein
VPSMLCRYSSTGVLGRFLRCAGCHGAQFCHNLVCSHTQFRFENFKNARTFGRGNSEGTNPYKSVCWFSIDLRVLRSLSVRC